MYYSEQKKQHTKDKDSLTTQQINFDKTLAAELEAKLSTKEKEIEKLQSIRERETVRVDAYLSILNELAINNKPYQSLITKLKTGLEKSFKQNVIDQEKKTKKEDL